MVIQLYIYQGHVVPDSASSSGMPSLRDELQHLGGSTKMHWIRKRCWRSEEMWVLGPQGHQRPLMALTSINLDTVLFYFQLFLCTLWHPAVLFVLELGQTVLFPTSGIFISCSFLTMSKIAPLHENYPACFLWLIFAVPYIFEASCPSPPLVQYFCSKEQGMLLYAIWNFWSTYH